MQPSDMPPREGRKSLILGLLGLLVGILAWRYPHFWESSAQAPPISINLSVPSSMGWSPADIGLMVFALGVPVGLIARASHDESAKASILVSAGIGGLVAFVSVVALWTATFVLGPMSGAWACLLALVLTAWIVRLFVSFVAFASRPQSSGLSSETPP